MSLITLPKFLDVAEGANLFPQDALKSYRDFLVDPTEWQLQRGLVIPKPSDEIMQKKGYRLVELSSDDAVKLGAPPGKVKEGVIYFKKE